MAKPQIGAVLEALNRRDLDSAVAAFAPDARLFSDNCNVLQGKDAIRAALARRLSEAKSVQFEVKGEDVRLITPDVAVIELDVDARGVSGGTPKSRWVSVVKLVGSEWQVQSQWVIACPPARANASTAL